ncbi:uncharacterized protein METZ01_LOCUS60415 [marine metagenome]|uniref:Uncharacterized protein n=1 Tax=marine metagenome TaxID=408172 RepID=A0A381SW80_9ZZZZ
MRAVQFEVAYWNPDRTALVTLRAVGAVIKRTIPPKTIINQTIIQSRGDIEARINQEVRRCLI